MSVIQLENISFQYDSNHAFSLSIQTLSIEARSRVYIEGPSGCGKTTFLNMLTGLLCPTQGCVQVLGTDISTLSATQRDRFRADHIGVIFQQFNLIPYLSVIENIVLPCMFSTRRKEKALAVSSSLEEEAMRLCRQLDMDDALLQQSVHNLSIGQQQRVAIARALIGQPEIIVADEPTSALDEQRKEQFMALLLQECKAYGATLIFVSHDPTLKPLFEQSYRLAELNTASRENAHVVV